MLEGAEINLVCKEYEEASKEHVADRFLQVKDNFAICIEERPTNRRLGKYNLLEGDITDLFRVDPHHAIARNYWYAFNQEQVPAEVKMPVPPSDVPKWAFLQVEALKRYQDFVEWYIDNRQIEYGDFGGGLSDDGDLTNYWPPVALMGYKPEKISNSIFSEMEAMYDNGMFTDGLPTIQTDGLHVYEEGIQVLPQTFLLDFGNPKTIERMMETTKNLGERIIGKNKNGHYHFRSNYFSATKIADEGVWEWSTHPQYMMLQPAMYLAKFYKNAGAIDLIKKVADGIIAHTTKDKNGKLLINTDINFRTDETSPKGGIAYHFNRTKTSRDNVANGTSAAFVLWSAWELTGNKTYLQPIL